MAELMSGQVPGTIHVLTGVEARAQAPELFNSEDGPYFNELGANGNSGWVDYWPDLVLIVRNLDGDVVLASNASAWHMISCGYPVATDRT